MVKDTFSNNTQITNDMLAQILATLQAQGEAIKSLMDEQTPATIIQSNAVSSRGRRAKMGFKFTKKEIDIMPSRYQNIFACGDTIIPYRYHKGVYEVNYRRKGIHIYACASTIEEMKRRFLDKLMRGEQVNHNKPKRTATYNIPKTYNKTTKPPQGIPFAHYVDEWLASKRFNVKESPFKEYQRVADTHLKRDFMGVTMAEMTRSRVQEYLFGFVEQEKHRTAEKLSVAFSCIFDLAVEDKVVESNPMKKIKLPYAERKKGSAFTLQEEAELVNICRKNLQSDWAHAFLVLVYFGLRKSELTSIKIKDENLSCISSKTRLGRKEVVRTIPFTPVFKRVLPYVDFNRAKRANPNTMQTAMRKYFPNHHIHELRYTFITRCKECGVAGEVVMQWDGHSYDRDVVTSLVDRGYTDFSQEFLQRQALKVDYELPTLKYGG